MAHLAAHTPCRPQASPSSTFNSLLPPASTLGGITAALLTVAWRMHTILNKCYGTGRTPSPPPSPGVTVAHHRQAHHPALSSGQELKPFTPRAVSAQAKCHYEPPGRVSLYVLGCSVSLSLGV